ncbi:MAG: DUF4293 domain-containing protein [Bacteroidota bacterium]
MIQRKQSAFLFLASVILSITFFFPLATFIGEADSLVLYVYKVISLVPDSVVPLSPYFVLPLFSLVSLVVVLSFITIFLFKNRKRQLILVRFMLLLLLVYIGVFFFFYVDILSNISGGIANYPNGITIPSTDMEIPTIVFIVPLASAILLFMASSGIISDEKLIRSADRLR